MVAARAELAGGAARRGRGATRQRGFTLVELLVVMVISVIGLLGSLAVHLAATRGQMRARAITEAVNLGQDRLEALRRAPLATLVPSVESGLGADGHPAAGGVYARRTTVEVGPVETRVHVEVSWAGEDGARHAVLLHTARTP